MAASKKKRPGHSKEPVPIPASGTRVVVKMPAAAPPPAIQSPPQNPVRTPRNMCYGCNGACCHLRVDITLFDIARIFHMEGKSIEEYAVLVCASENDRFAIRLEGGMLKLVLQEENSACTFFRDGDLRCSIENAKPGLCLGYPFSMRDGIPYLRDNVSCPLSNLMRADRMKMSAKTLDDIFYEARRYEEVIRLWNSSTKGNERLDAFIKFASNDLEADRSSVGGLQKSLGRFMLRIGLR